ncbi:MAG: ABC transporter ATP-binding protein [Desulfobacterales bacterium]
MTEPILKLENLCKYFGGVVAVDFLNIAVQSATITSIIGPNGAGKTTIFNLITGFIKPSSGKIFYTNKDISGFRPYMIAGMQVARTFQNVQIFPQMTVLENVMVGRHARSRSGFMFSTLIPPFFRTEEIRIREDAMQCLSITELSHLAQKPAGSLPLGNQRQLEIARALAVEPKLLLLDEPASGLNARETYNMGKLIQRIKEMDITVALVEHDMELVMDISDKVNVVNFGRCIASGDPSDIQSNTDVIAAYLGV